MLTQNMLHMHDGKSSLRRINSICDCSRSNQMRLTDQIKDRLLTGAHISELPSYEAFLCPPPRIKIVCTRLRFESNDERGEGARVTINCIRIFMTMIKLECFRVRAATEFILKETDLGLRTLKTYTSGTKSLMQVYVS